MPYPMKKKEKQMNVKELIKALKDVADEYKGFPVIVYSGGVSGVKRVVDVDVNPAGEITLETED
tara:strand:+ start:195 stop:386 length:192 start_codon:yes stop_codon:yes gene_type:complete